MPESEFVYLPYDAGKTETFTSPMQAEHDDSYKIVMLGESDADKTNLLSRFADNKYTESYLDTVGVKSKIKTIEEQGKTVQLQIHDDAPTGRFKTINENNFMGARAVVLAYNSTFDGALDKALELFSEMTHRETLRNLPVILVATKMDGTRAISAEAADARIKAWNEDPKNAARKITAHIETSAKTGVNVNAVFHTAAGQIMAKKPVSNANPTNVYRSQVAENREGFVDPKAAFLRAHERDRKSGLFGSLFTRTRITRDTPLEQIVENALRDNSRSRRVFVELGWLDALGNIGTRCPSDVSDLIEAKKNGIKPSSP